jgi:lantibiotic modifying enzyme
MDIKKIAAAASYIEERHTGEFVSVKRNGRSEEKREAWRKLLNVVPDKKIFETRLEQEGIGDDEALEICGDAEFLAQAKLPGWAVSLQAVAGMFPLEKDALWEKVAVKKEDIKLTGPLAALLPFILYAEGKLSEKYPDGESLPITDLSDILLKRLYYLCAPTFNAKARMMAFLGQVSAQDGDKVWPQMEDALLGGEWVTTFEEYPVLTKRIGVTIENYLNFMEESLDRFFEKKKTLEDAFFGGGPIHKIVNITGEISDLHQKGKSVLIYTFDGERRLVYKPRPLEIDVAWEEFLTHFTTEKSSIKAPHALDFGHYGFIEYIEHRPCNSREELKTYYYNAGALMALLFAFGGNDFHMENIVASGTTPVIIDTETLMIPVARFFGKGGKDDPEDEESKRKEESLEAVIDQSVIKMGFLPMWQKDGENKRADYGGLTGDKPDMKNLPVYEGQRYPGNEFSDEITGGFRDMYRLVMDRQEELLHGEKGIRLFERCKFRMLIRNSQVYGNMLQHIAQPSLLKSGFDYSMTTDRLVNAFLYDAHESIIPELMNVFRSEKNAMERGDIPIFYGEPDGEGILDEEGMLFAHYFEKSAIGNARERIPKFSENDLAVQLQIIDKSMASEVRNVHEYYSDSGSGDGAEAADHRLLSREELLAEAKAIYREVMDNRFVAKDGDYSWLSEQYDLARSGTSLNITGPFLYDGLLGIAVFAAALYAVTKDKACFETAEHCAGKAGDYLSVMIPNMERYKANLGYSSGMAGCIAGLSFVSAYLGQEKGYEAAVEIVLGITEKMVRDDTVYDVLGGISGLVLALTQDERWLAHPKTKDHVSDILKWCGEHLLERKNEETDLGFPVWKSKEATQPLTGLGHGAAGIALALFRLYRIFGDERYLKAGEDAVAYENSIFDKEAGNWPDFRKDPSDQGSLKKKFMAGYCAGAPGIGLARLDGIKRINRKAKLEKSMSDDICRADRFVRSIKNEGRNHLCCGSAGRIDFLVEEAFRLSDSEAGALAHRILSDLVAGKQKRGHYNFHVVNGKYYYNPTLFQGTAGIGYEILRFLAPEKVRSILI